MRKLNLLNTVDLQQNYQTIMNAFRNDVWTPNHEVARFSVPADSKQQGFYQRVNGIVYFYCEINPDINNPFGGGATVAFIAGDVITLPILTISPQIAVPGDFFGYCSVVLTQMSNLAKFNQCRVETNIATGAPQISIGHNIPATASSFALEGIYIVKA